MCFKCIHFQLAQPWACAAFLRCLRKPKLNRTHTTTRQCCSKLKTWGRGLIWVGGQWFWGEGWEEGVTQRGTILQCYITASSYRGRLVPQKGRYMINFKYRIISQQLLKWEHDSTSSHNEREYFKCVKNIEHYMLCITTTMFLLFEDSWIELNW